MREIKDEFDDVIREYIDFVNQQTGMYMDAMAGFAGHRTRVERQVHRIIRPSQKNGNVVTWTSYEDPSKSEIIHTRIIRAENYIEINSQGGSNEQQHSCAIIVFLYTYWENETRPRLAKIKKVDIGEIRSDIMGDLREVRHTILHTKKIFTEEKYKKLKVLKNMFDVGQPIFLSYEKMHNIFGMIKDGLAKMLINYIGVPSPTISREKFTDVAIQKKNR